MNIHPVRTPADLRAFIDLLYRIYRNDPQWVPPLRDEQKGQFDPVRNPLLEHCEYALFLLEEGEKPVGRIAAFIDRLAVEAWGEPVGLFGYYECPPDPAASRLLLETARTWLLERGMPAMRGPWSFVSQEWGAVVEGFTPHRASWRPTTRPSTTTSLQLLGWQRSRTCWCISSMPARATRSRSASSPSRTGWRRAMGCASARSDMKHFDREVQTIIDVSNQSLIDNWGYSPVTEAEVRAMAHDLKPVIHPKAVLFAEDRQGKPIGIAIAIPDVNVILKKMNGSLFPLGWLRLLWGLPRLKTYRMFALGVVPEYHGKAIDTLLYRALYEACYSAQVRMEINYVLEDNGPMNNAILKLNARPLRRYRVYQMAI